MMPWNETYVNWDWENYLNKEMGRVEKDNKDNRISRDEVRKFNITIRMINLLNIRVPINIVECVQTKDMDVEFKIRKDGTDTLTEIIIKVPMKNKNNIWNIVQYWTAGMTSLVYNKNIDNKITYEYSNFESKSNVGGFFNDIQIFSIDNNVIVMTDGKYIISIFKFPINLELKEISKMEVTMKPLLIDRLLDEYNKKIFSKGDRI